MRDGLAEMEGGMVTLCGVQKLMSSPAEARPNFMRTKPWWQELRHAQQSSNISKGDEKNVIIIKAVSRHLVYETKQRLHDHDLCMAKKPADAVDNFRHAQCH